MLWWYILIWRLIGCSYWKLRQIFRRNKYQRRQAVIIISLPTWIGFTKSQRIWTTISLAPCSINVLFNWVMSGIKIIRHLCKYKKYRHTFVRKMHLKYLLYKTVFRMKKFTKSLKTRFFLEYFCVNKVCLYFFNLHKNQKQWFLIILSASLWSHAMCFSLQICCRKNINEAWWLEAESKVHLSANLSRTAGQRV
jgi:hypothetical protein